MAHTYFLPYTGGDAASILQILINRINIFYDPYDACVMAYVCLMQ